MDAPRLGIVIPALNEAASIAAVIEAARGCGQVIVVDDGSTDETAAIAKRLGASVVSHEGRRGYDKALQSGIRRADELGLAYAVTLDADGQLPAALVPAFERELADGAGIVVGVRDRKARWAEVAFAWATNRLYGIRDPFCGMKGYDLSYFRKLGWFDSYGSVGTELMLFSVRNGAKLAQIPVPTKARAGVARFGGGLRPNLILARAALLGLARRQRASA